MRYMEFWCDEVQSESNSSMRRDRSALSMDGTALTERTDLQQTCDAFLSHWGGKYPMNVLDILRTIMWFKYCRYHFAKSVCFNITKLVVVGLFPCIRILLLKGWAACTEYWEERV